MSIPSSESILRGFLSIGGISAIWWLISVHQKVRASLHQKYGILVLPFNRSEQKRFVRRASERRDDLIKDLLRGHSTPLSTLQAAALHLPAQRQLESAIMRVALGRYGPRAIELYADRWQGKSILLAQLAVAMSTRRSVLYVRWPDLYRALVDGAESLPGLPYLRADLCVTRSPLPNLLQPPWWLIDDCPPRGLALHHSDTTQVPCPVCRQGSMVFLLRFEAGEQPCIQVPLLDTS